MLVHAHEKSRIPFTKYNIDSVAKHAIDTTRPIEMYLMNMNIWKPQIALPL